MHEGKPIAVLADDEEVYIVPYSKYLEELGYEVLTARTKSELLESATGASVLVVDACLPKVEQMEGIEAVAGLLSENQKGGSRIAADVPIIFISGYREDTPIVRDKLGGYEVLRRRGYGWFWKEDEIQLLSDAIENERNRLRGI
jgi:CheY-like chemotaxis protein